MVAYVVGCCGDCDACTVVCVACVFAARLLWCEGDGNAGEGSGGGVVSAYMGGTRRSGVLASAGEVQEMSVVRGVGGVYDMCMARGGRCWGGVRGEWVRGLGQGLGGWGGVMSGLSVLMAGAGICILC